MIFNMEHKYEILLSLILDSAYMGVTKDKLIFDERRMANDVRTFLEAYEPDKYNERYKELNNGV